MYLLPFTKTFIEPLMERETRTIRGAKTESIVIDGLAIPDPETLSNLDEVVNYGDHLLDRRKYLKSRNKIENDSVIEAEIQAITALHKTYVQRYDTLSAEQKKEQRRRREQKKREEKREEKRLEEKRKQEQLELQRLWIADSEKRKEKQGKVQEQLDEVKLALAEKQKIRDERLLLIERELGIDTLTTQIAKLQKKHDKLNKSELQCPHLNVTTENIGFDPRYPCMNCSYCYSITCNLCGDIQYDSKEVFF